MNSQILLKDLFTAFLQPNLKRVFSRGVPDTIQQCMEMAKREKTYQMENEPKNDNSHKNENVLHNLTEAKNK